MFEENQPSKDTSVSIGTLLVKWRLTVDQYCSDLALST